jgi:hypothetical protein
MGLSSHWTDFHEIWYLGIFRKSVEDFQASLQSVKENGYFAWRHMNMYIVQFFLKWEMFQKIAVQNPHFMSNKFFPRKSRDLWDNVEEYGRARLTTYDSMAHALCMLHNCCRRHTPRICNTYCFPTATTVTLTRLNATFIHTLLVIFHLKLLSSLVFGLKDVCRPWMVTHINTSAKKKTQWNQLL